VVATSDRPGTYVEIERTWKTGDVVDLALAMHVSAAPLPASSEIFALTYGPLVLAGALGDEGVPHGGDIVQNERKYGEYLDTPFEAPRLAGDADRIVKSVRPAGGSLAFTVPDAQGRPVRLKPYHQVAHERYATYWQVEPPRLA
jgi:DUF1680 family protein